jgi:hypothetical protein
MREFRISEIDVAKTLSKAQKIAARGKSKGLSGGFEVSIQSRFEESNGVQSEYSVLVIEGEPVKYNGWQFVGVAEFIEGKALTKSIAGGVEIKSSDVQIGYCEYCKKIRSRSKVIFVQNEEGKLSQVGSSCVKDFLGWEFSASALVTEEDFEEEFGGFSGGSYSGFDTLSVLALAVCAVEKVGFVPSGSGLSTKEIVWEKLVGGTYGLNKWKEIIGQEVTDAHREKAQELREFGKGFEGDSSYAENVRLVSGLTFQKYNTVGILVSLLKAAQRQAEPKIEKKSYKSEILAPVGEKVEVEVTVLSENTFESQFGLTTLYTFESGEYQLKWFSSRGLNVEVGTKFTLKGTVKGTDEYKGAFSTVLTRCKAV